MTKDISSNIKDKKLDEQKVIEEIKAKEEQLKEDVKKEEIDPYDNYITLRVKKAQLSWTYLEHFKKMKEIKDILFKTRSDLDEYDRTNPDFKESYLEKYLKAREDAGLKDTKEQLDNSFLKFLVEDAEIPGLDNTNINFD